MPFIYNETVKDERFINTFVVSKRTSAPRQQEPDAGGRRYKENPALLPHQQDIVDHFNSPQFKSPCLLYFSMGSGKTLASLMCALELSKRAATRNPNVVVVCDISIIDQWIATIERLHVEHPITFVVMSYNDVDKAVRTSTRLGFRVHMGIVDEIQRFKNLTSAMRPLVDLIVTWPVLLYLTGTPIINDASDAHGLLYLLHRKTTGDLREVSKGHVAYYDPKDDPCKREFFPTVQTLIERVTMSWPQTLHYFSLRQNLFRLGDFSVQRVVQNRYKKAQIGVCNYFKSAEQSTKVMRVLENVLKYRPLGKQVIYSSRLTMGLDPIAEVLHKRKVPFCRIDGATEARKRNEVIKRYNGNKCDVLLLSPALSRGVDLMDTYVFHVLEPLDNTQTYNQTLTRAVRFKSHTGDNKVVHVVNYVSVFPGTPVTSVDGDLRQIFGMAIKTAQVKLQLQALVREEGQTVNERQLAWNEAKEVEVQQLCAVLKSNSIRMGRVSAGIRSLEEKREKEREKEVKRVRREVRRVEIEEEKRLKEQRRVEREKRAKEKQQKSIMTKAKAKPKAKSVVKPKVKSVVKPKAKSKTAKCVVSMNRL